MKQPLWEKVLLEILDTVIPVTIGVVFAIAIAYGMSLRPL